MGGERRTSELNQKYFERKFIPTELKYEYLRFNIEEHEKKRNNIGSIRTGTLSLFLSANYTFS